MKFPHQTRAQERGGRGRTAAALLALAPLLLALAVPCRAAPANGPDGSSRDTERLQIVIDPAGLPAGDLARSKDRLEAIEQAIASGLPLLRSFDPREVLAGSLAELSGLGVDLGPTAIVNFDTIEADVPVAHRAQVERLAWVKRLRRPIPATPAGTFDSEGLAEIGSDVANAAGVTGSGVTVAIIDEGFAHLDNAITAAELKSIPTANQFYVKRTTTDPTIGPSGATTPINLHGKFITQFHAEHGTAAAEVVNEVAPDVDFLLYGFQPKKAGTQHEGGVTIDQISWAIRSAADNGADVILVSMSVISTLSDPVGILSGGTNPFTDDIDYATAAGAVVVVASGDEAMRQVTETFSPCVNCTNDPSTGTCNEATNDTDFHAWDPTFEALPLNDIFVADEVDDAETIDVLTCYSATDAVDPSKFELKLFKFFEGPPNGSCGDPSCPHDCGVNGVTGTAVSLGESFSVKDLPLYDADFNQYFYYLTVRRKAGSTEMPTIRVACSTNVSDLYWFTEGTSSLSDLAAVTNAVAVGGLDALGDLLLESSIGPTSLPGGPIKPDLVGPGEVTNFTTFDFGYSFDVDFIGTSAAAAHVAGVVALMQSQRIGAGLPKLSIDDLKDELRHAAIDQGAPGPDDLTGAGLVQVPAFARKTGANVTLEPLPSPVTVGQPATCTGSGFSAGSVILLFVATSSGPVSYGPFTPSAWSPTALTWTVDPSISLGNGFATALVVNTDQGFVQSNTESQLLFGDQGLNMPTILGINGTALSAFDPSIPTANVETIIPQGSTVTITGTGFNNPLVNLFTAAGNVGPLAPLPGGTSTQFQIVVPAGTVTGPGSFQVVNSPYVGNVLSNAVSAPIGEALDITAISQSGTTITVDGAGFSSLSVINLFNAIGGSAVNLGGLNPDGSPKIPLTVVSEHQFTFEVPAGAATGNAYVMVLNPPFIPFSSTTGDPDGAFSLVVP